MMKRDGARLTPGPTIVLVGGRLTLDDGSQVDSQQPMKDAATARAVQRALVSCAEWWSAVVSVVIPTLDDAEGGFALADQRTIARVTSDGRVSRVRLPRYPRGGGQQDYIYSMRTLGQTAGPGGAPPTASRGRRRSPEPPRRTSRSPRIRIHASGSVAGILDEDGRAYPGTSMFLLPDTAAVRLRIGALLDDRLQASASEPEDRPWEDPYRHLRLSVERAECAVTALVLDGRWQDPSELEAARRLLLERFDLKVGLWDLALNPVLRATVLSPLQPPRVFDTPAEVPTVARRRAEQEAGGVARALHPGLAPVGWKLTRFGLQHPVAKAISNAESDQPKHPYLRLIVGHRNVRVLVWHWYYTTFDINAFVDARRESFDAISVLPDRKRLAASSAGTLAKYRKHGEIAYEPGRLLNDTRWVLLWSADKGWADIDTDWSSVSAQIAERTLPWVALLADAIAQCLGIERRTLRLVDRGSA
jgi:hypothetical protein